MKHEGEIAKHLIIKLLNTNDKQKILNWQWGKKTYKDKDEIRYLTGNNTSEIIIDILKGLKGKT